MESCARLTSEMLLKEVRKASTKNIVLSPLSFNAILNMTAAGSTGHTREQMLKFLEAKDIDDLNSQFSSMMVTAFTKSKHNNNTDGDPILSFLNCVLVNKDFPLNFFYQDLVKRVYKTKPKNVDFNKAKELVDAANAWAEAATKGWIKDVLRYENITPQTKLIHGNALYFKAAWEDEFCSDYTMDRYFYLLNGDKVSVPFMGGCHNFYHGSFEGFEIARIPYYGGIDDQKRKFSMYIFLPNKTDGLPSLLEKLNSEPPGFFRRDFKLKFQNVDIFRIPKFEFSYRTEKAPETIMSMGLTLPFNEDCKELTEMIEIESDVPFYVSSIVQKAYIKVDEGGTEAAAATFSEPLFGCSLYSPPPTCFIADHPFLFMVREENSGLVFFTGAVLNPSLKDD